MRVRCPSYRLIYLIYLFFVFLSRPPHIALPQKVALHRLHAEPCKNKLVRCDDGGRADCTTFRAAIRLMATSL
jgi:hypothetical protein